jgi:hypothetical protein
MKYEDFKLKTLEAEKIIDKARDMRALTEDFAVGFRKAMWEAREIFMRLEDQPTQDESEE